jgi:transcription elongation factor Elf1
MSLIDEKFISLVSSRLDKYKRLKSGLYTFRCPYCGDSQKYKNKTRGYLYVVKNDYNFKCHNCGYSRSFTNFLKDLDPIMYDQYVMERYKKGITGKKSNTPEPEFNFKKPSFAKKHFDLPRIKDLDPEHLAFKYIKGRKIPDKFLKELYYCDNFKEWTNTQKFTFKNTDNDEPRIIIPLIKDNEIFGYQGRSLKKSSKVKYITIVLDENQPKIFGLNNVDLNKKVYIVEGPFDSMFIENAIAMVGSDVDYKFFKSYIGTEFIFVYDNEKRNKQIVDRMEKVIDNKFPIVIWPQDLKYKDINDMIIEGVDVQKILKENTFMGLQAKAKLIGWKRV